MLQFILRCLRDLPDMTENLSSCKSPQQMFGAVLKTYYAEKMGIDPKKIVHVVVTPCTAKKAEILREEMNAAGRLLGDPAMRDTDLVLTTVELADWAKSKRISFADLPDGKYDRLMAKVRAPPPSSAIPAASWRLRFAPPTAT